MEKNWKSDKKIEINISVRFSINPEKEMKYHDDATFQIISYPHGHDTCNIRTTEYLTEMAEYSIEYEDYESAIIYLKELINRFPFNKEYQKLYENTWKKIKE